MYILRDSPWCGLYVWTMCVPCVDKTVIYGFYQKGHPEVKNKIPSQAGRINLVKTNWEGTYACWRRRKRYYAIIWPKIEKIDFACRSTAKNRQKNAFFRFSQKCIRSPLYIKKARRMCLGHPKCIFPAIYRPYDHLKWLWKNHDFWSQKAILTIFGYFWPHLCWCGILPEVAGIPIYGPGSGL